MRKPKVKDLVVTGKNNLSDIERTIQLIANLAEITVESYEKYREAMRAHR